VSRCWVVAGVVVGSLRICRRCDGDTVFEPLLAEYEPAVLFELLMPALVEPPEVVDELMLPPFVWKFDAPLAEVVPFWQL
jgi:hypothetical protein